MGGHGALSIFLKNPNKYKSASAFAPICHPVNCDWGKNAFTGYLGSNEENWKVLLIICSFIYFFISRFYEIKGI
jgi:S-formylglutathione hydrolase FrmB